LMDSYTATNNYKKAYEASTKRQILNDRLNIKHPLITMPS